MRPAAAFLVCIFISCIPFKPQAKERQSQAASASEATVLQIEGSLAQLQGGWGGHVVPPAAAAKERQSQAASASEATVLQIEGSLAQLRGARDAASNRRKEAWRAEQDAAESMARLLEEQRKRRQVWVGGCAAGRRVTGRAPAKRCTRAGGAAAQQLCE
eukprot:529225-Pelagomonas_calceolata.AAC.1